MADPVRGTGLTVLKKKSYIFDFFATHYAPKSNILIQNREKIFLPKFRKFRLGCGAHSFCLRQLRDHEAFTAMGKVF